MDIVRTVSQQNQQAYTYGPDEGKVIKGRGATVLIKTSSRETNGAWALIEYNAPAHFDGPPPHIHKKMTEAFYILSGTVTFFLEGQTLKAPAGSYVFVPTNTVHTFANKEAIPASFLTFVSPGGFENYFEELAAMLAIDGGEWPPVDPRPYEALSLKYDMYPPEEKEA